MTEERRLEVIVTAFAKALLSPAAVTSGLRRQRRVKSSPAPKLPGFEEPAPTIRELDEQFGSLLRRDDRIPDLDFENEDLDAVDMTRASGPGMS
jgi:hypothetical protein